MTCCTEGCKGEANFRLQMENVLLLLCLRCMELASDSGVPDTELTALRS